MFFIGGKKSRASMPKVCRYDVPSALGSLLRVSPDEGSISLCLCFCLCIHNIVFIFGKGQARVSIDP